MPKPRVNRDHQRGHDVPSNNNRDSAQAAIIETQAAVIKTQAGVIEANARTIERLTLTIERQSRMLEENNRIPVHPASEHAQFPNVQLTPEPPRRQATPVPHNFGEVSIDMSNEGDIYQDSFEHNISMVSSKGCILISIILETLREGAFKDLKTWNPHRPEAKKVAGRTLKVMLSPQYIHLFSEERLIIAAGEDSVWSTIVFAALPEITKEEQMSWVKYFASNTANKNSGFGKFATAVVRVHNEFCEEC